MLVLPHMKIAFSLCPLSKHSNQIMKQINAFEFDKTLLYHLSKKNSAKLETPNVVIRSPINATNPRGIKHLRFKKIIPQRF